MSDPVIQSTILTLIIGVVLLIIATVLISVKLLYKFKPKHIEKKNKEWKIVACVLILIIFGLIANIITFHVRLTMYESIEEMTKGMDELAKDTKTNVGNVNIPDFSQISSNTFEGTKRTINSMTSHSDVVKKEYEDNSVAYRKIMSQQSAMLLSFSTAWNNLKEYAKAKSCNLNIEWDSDVFKIDGRVTKITDLVLKQATSLNTFFDSFENGLKNQIISELVNEEKKVSNHLESTKNLIEFLQKHSTSLYNISENKQTYEISPTNLIISIFMIWISSIVVILVCGFLFGVIYRFIYRPILVTNSWKLDVGYFMIAGQMILAFLLMFAFSYLGFWNNPCQPDIISNNYKMSAFDDASTIDSDEVFHTCSSTKTTLLTQLEKQIYISSDHVIKRLQKNQNVRAIEAIPSTDFDSLLIEWDKVRELRTQMMGLDQQQTCFDQTNQQKIKNYREMLNELVEGSEKYGNATATIIEKEQNIVESIIRSFFEDLKSPIEVLSEDINSLIKPSFDFDCYSISALRLKCAKLQCPTTYQYLDEVVLHLIIVFGLSVLLLLIFLRSYCWFVEYNIKKTETLSPTLSPKPHVSSLIEDDLKKQDEKDKEKPTEDA